MNTLQLIDGFRTGETDLISHVASICDRIEQEEPTLSALVPGTFDRDQLLSNAQTLVESGSKQRPLFGMPFGVKDIFRVTGYPTQCGSRLPASEFEGDESSVVTKLRSAGALFVGKTVTTEFAAYHPGSTTNPHDPAHTPGGSSSGSAAGVAKGYFPFALGTQTVGSIARPAAFCGVVGYKPSYGRTATDGVIEYSRTMDHVGWLCADTSALSRLGSVLVDEWRTATAPTANSDIRLGIPEGPYLANASGHELHRYAQITSRLEQHGVTVVACPMLEDIEVMRDRHDKIIFAELAQVHREWFANYRELYSETLDKMILRGQTVAAADLEAMVQDRTNYRSHVTQAMHEANVDALIAPGSVDVAPRGLESTGNPIMNLPWTHTGLPTVSVPCHPKTSRLPHGVQLVGSFAKDEELVALADYLSPWISAS